MPWYVWLVITWELFIVYTAISRVGKTRTFTISGNDAVRIVVMNGFFIWVLMHLAGAV